MIFMEEKRRKTAVSVAEWMDAAVFAVGDNREWSLDCRYQQCGLIDSRSIVGVVIYVS